MRGRFATGLLQRLDKVSTGLLTALRLAARLVGESRTVLVWGLENCEIVKL